MVSKDELMQEAGTLSTLLDAMSAAAMESKMMTLIAPELDEAGQTILLHRYEAWMKTMSGASEETQQLADFVRDLVEAGKENSGRSQAR